MACRISGGIISGRVRSRQSRRSRGTRMAYDFLLTRRDVLRRAGCLIAAPALPPARIAAAATARTAASGQKTAADLSISDVMSRLSTYMAVARERMLPGDAIEKAK